MRDLVTEFVDHSIDIVRYKIEGTMIDSKFQGDFLNIVPNSGGSYFVKGVLNL